MNVSQKVALLTSLPNTKRGGQRSSKQMGWWALSLCYETEDMRDENVGIYMREVYMREVWT